MRPIGSVYHLPAEFREAHRRQTERGIINVRGVGGARRTKRRQGQTSDTLKSLVVRGGKRGAKGCVIVGGLLGGATTGAAYGGSYGAGIGAIGYGGRKLRRTISSRRSRR